MRNIYFSPHLDDAVLSAGGWIRAQSAQGTPVEIWTFMAGVPETRDLTPFAQTMHSKWGFETAEQAVQARRAEDVHAAAYVGARVVHFDFLDCIYRRGRQGQPLYSDVFVPVAPDDADLPAQIAQAMIAWLRPDDQLICQLGVGRHVDHVIVRKAAELLRRPLAYCADIPYVLDHPDELARQVSSLRNSFHPVSGVGLQCWISAIECYVSQIDAVFGSHEAMLMRMHAHWLEHRGLYIWTQSTAPAHASISHS